MARIVSGNARGHTLKVPPEGTRPTSDRAKEGLFSSLQVRFGFNGRTVADLFAGSGALGLEALSRGADSVVLVENHKPAVKIIEHNIAKVNMPGARVDEMKVSTWVKSAPREHFDMILADPPYDLPDEDVTEMVNALRPLLIDGAVVVVERHRESPETAWPADFHPTTQKLKKRTYGIARMDMAVYEKAE